MTKETSFTLSAAASHIMGEPNIRYVRRPRPPEKAGVFIDNMECVLQVACKNFTTGGYEWVDVPTVDQPGEKR